MRPRRRAHAPVVLGIAGGSGSGKSWLASRLAAAFGPRAGVVCHDWWYRDRRGLSPAGRGNFDHPRALETSLMRRQLDELLAGRPIEAPVYDYATHSRMPRTRRVEPRPLLIVEGILALHEPALRARMDFSVFIEVADDLRLLRRVRRDVKERRVDLEETLRLYESSVRPMHRRFVAPSARWATWVWRPEEDRAFPALLRRRLAASLGGRC